MKRIAILAAGFGLMAGVAMAQQGNPGAHFVENWDLNADGQVTLAEATERRSDVFASFDANEDGLLDAAEYDMFDEARANDMAENAGAHGGGNGNGFGAAATGMERGFNDADGDGKVSLAEFLAKTEDWLAIMDRNGDSVVTTDDFGH